MSGAGQMRIAVTGLEGQVARSLLERAPALGHEVIALGRPAFDLAGDTEQIARAIADTRAHVIVSAAAYTAVDRAETDRAEAEAINLRGAAAVAGGARRIGAPLIHLSTDYVFDGSKPSPYTEEDPTSPATVYGETKRDAEVAVLAAYDNAAVLRTAWVYSPFGNNFVKTMLRLASDRNEIGVVADQHGNPTSALDIADGLLAVAANLIGSSRPSLRGIFHMAGRGTASWAELAGAIFEASRRAGGPSAIVRPIDTKDYPTPARRPANSRLDCSKIELVHGVALPHWESSIVQVVERLVGPAKPTTGNV